ncbi:MAG: hypothetical protein GVY18_03340 [Bacteroidetes bacterium]|nr:hypothetical protein [Bacteroidota bacterium]
MPVAFCDEPRTPCSILPSRRPKNPRPMRRLFFLLLCSTLILWYAGCDATDDESGTVTLNGTVFDASRNQPLADAFVTVAAEDNPDIDDNEDIIVQTDDNGEYTVSFDIDQPTEVDLTARKNGFTTDQQSIFVTVGVDEVPRFSLQRTRDEEPTSGSPSNILLLSQTSESIGVVAGGAQEVATLTFQVADSAGRPVTLENEALVRFRLGVQPGGGEFVAPEQAGTNDEGQVEVNLSSGTRAGIVQVIAESDIDGQTIRSKPVPISIHGGFPDAVHFSAGPDVFNFAGLQRFGITNPASVRPRGRPLRQPGAAWLGGVLHHERGRHRRLRADRRSGPRHRGSDLWTSAATTRRRHHLRRNCWHAAALRCQRAQLWRSAHYGSVPRDSLRRARRDGLADGRAPRPDLLAGGRRPERQPAGRRHVHQRRGRGHAREGHGQHERHAGRLGLPGPERRRRRARLRGRGARPGHHAVHLPRRRGPEHRRDGRAGRRDRDHHGPGPERQRRDRADRRGQRRLADGECRRRDASRRGCRHGAPRTGRLILSLSATATGRARRDAIVRPVSVTLFHTNSG